MYAQASWIQLGSFQYYCCTSWWEWGVREWGRKGEVKDGEGSGAAQKWRRGERERAWTHATAGDAWRRATTPQVSPTSSPLFLLLFYYPMRYTLHYLQWYHQQSSYRCWLPLLLLQAIDASHTQQLLLKWSLQSSTYHGSTQESHKKVHHFSTLLALQTILSFMILSLHRTIKCSSHLPLLFFATLT